MLEGITVLNQTPVMEGIISGWIMLTLLIGGLGLFVTCLICDSNHIRVGTIICGVLCVLCLVAFFILALWWPTEPSGRYRYECTIDESVSMTEVYERYEVIEQRGDIWVLEDRE